MKDINIEAGKDTLCVKCQYESGLIELEGISYPQDAAEFFNPIFEWLDQYIDEVASGVSLNLRINYLNTSSTKCLFDIIYRLEEHYQAGNKVMIKWYYEEDDEDIKETGLEFQEDMDVPFELVAY